MSPIHPVHAVSPHVVRALVRQALEERLGLRPPTISNRPATARAGTTGSHPSLSDIVTGPECSEDLDLPLRKPCLIEPHRPCYNSGYCKKLGH